MNPKRAAAALRTMATLDEARAVAARELAEALEADATVDGDRDIKPANDAQPAPRRKRVRMPRIPGDDVPVNDVAAEKARQMLRAKGITT